MHNYLDQIRKPKDMKVSTFVARYKILIQLYQQLPGVPATNYFTDEMVKTRVFYAYGTQWLMGATKKGKKERMREERPRQPLERSERREDQQHKKLKVRRR